MTAEREEAIEHIKSYRKLDENLHNVAPEGTISSLVTKKCLKYWDMAIKALEQQEPCEDAVSRQAVKEQMIKYGFHAPDMTVTEFVEDLQPVDPQTKTGQWIHHKEKSFDCAEHWECSQCHRTTMTNPFPANGNDYDAMYYCSKCGAKMFESQESESE